MRGTTMELICHKRIVPDLLLLFLCISSSLAQAYVEKQRAWNNTVSAIYVFGDSTVDSGNNNYINTAFRSDFSPYGRDFVNQMPTGRFTNGRLTTDFIASYVGVKDYIPPYLDPTLSIEELMTGNVIDIPKQLEYFKEYTKRLEQAIGKQRVDKHIKKAVFIISAGTNDFVVNYFALPIRRKTYTTVSSYQQFLLQNAKNFIQDILQDLWEEGARNIIVSGLPPMGCLPVVITLNSDNAILQRGCIEKYSTVAREFNLMLQNEVNLMHFGLANLGAKIYLIDIYRPLTDMIQVPSKHGFDEVESGCCGSGYMEAGFLCNAKSYVCPDASKYVFWDSIHPTEKTYNIVFRDILNIIDAIIRD
ncbi:hypothetical protein JRO89_XS06G0059700 [Xanthoceras sorbifolium]|uniref:GDSL esterase/lipase At5g45960-like n=1 Tax=Xanthoceras sorbifolium TaxID=99658 RepID=A0ABQ8HWV3_9ROSI|nr:hypothetical protein JRO89_XS06G0059700 [Xanthoceras sorbifolium]